MSKQPLALKSRRYPEPGLTISLMALKMFVSGESAVAKRTFPSEPVRLATHGLDMDAQGSVD